MKNTKNFFLIALAILASTTFNACKKKGCTDPSATNYDAKAEKFDGSCIYDFSYTLPETYDFENVSYSGQTARLQLLNALADKVGEATTTNHVTYQELVDLYENVNELFGTDKDLASKTFVLDQQLFYDWFQEIDDSTSVGAGQDIDGRYYSSTGVEYKQMIEKGLMGAVFYYQATSTYLGADLGTDDNSAVEEGKGTDMQHHFDEAFGYFGVPVDHKTNTETEGDFTTTAWFWGKYGVSRDAVLGNRIALFEEFIRGRAAIYNKDYTTRDEAVTAIKEEWEKLIAANVVHYINDVNDDIDASATGDMYHHWSEAKAFAMCLKYNADKTITDSEWNQLDDALTDSPLNITTSSQLDGTLTLLKNIYGFSNSQMSNF